jgi:plastocyanin
MTSAINPNNIDTAYPVAGQDNNTQGFRDNFTFIKNNFSAAATEITALQNTSVVKGSTAVNDFGGGLIYDARVQDLSASAVDLGSVTGIVNINYAAGHYQQMATSGSITIAFAESTFPPGGRYGFVRLEITVSSVAHTVTLPGTVTINRRGIQGLTVNLDTTSTITFAAAGVYTFDFTTASGGNGTFTVNEVNKQLQPFNNSSEDLAPSAAASLATTTSYFTTAAAETATLAAGVEGQIKVFAMVATAGNMVITVANAGWKASGTGTMTFDAVGDACTLQYINAKWFCIGNNGCVFA